LDKSGCRFLIVLGFALDGAHYFGRSDTAALARKLITAAWPTHTFEDFSPYESLQQGFEMAWRQIEPPGKLLRRHRLWACVNRDIDDRGKRQDTTPVQKHHAFSPGAPTPVEP
jgi:hypothetical protein